MLLGTAVGGTLTALRTTIVSSEIGDEQAEVHAMLRAAEDALRQAAYYACENPITGQPAGPDPDEGIDAAEIRAWYENVIDALPRPPGWGADTVEISSLQFWQKSNGAEDWDPICSTDAQSRWSAQLIELYVLSPDGTVGRTIQVVKGGD